MRKKFGMAIVAALRRSIAVHAQGIFGGMERGAAEGSAAAGPVGGIVGGAGDGVKGCSASTQGHATIAIGRMSTDQLIAITGTIAIITDGLASALPAGDCTLRGTKRQRSHSWTQTPVVIATCMLAARWVAVGAAGTLVEDNRATLCARDQPRGTCGRHSVP